MRLGGLLLPVLVLDLADQPPPSLRMRSGSWLSLRSFAIALSKRSSKFWRPRFRFLIHAKIVAVPLDGTGPTFTGHFRSSDSENIRDVKQGEVFVETDTDHNKVVARGSDGSKVTLQEYFHFTFTGVSISAPAETRSSPDARRRAASRAALDDGVLPEAYAGLTVVRLNQRNAPAVMRTAMSARVPVSRTISRSIPPEDGSRLVEGCGASPTCWMSALS
jgi:hypothetical protein